MSNIAKQLEWVNIAKGIAICAVVLWHIDFVIPEIQILPLRSVLGATWHVPVFFLISGFFIKEEKLKNPQFFVRTKMSKLYVQLLCYYIPLTLLHNAFIDWGWYDITTDYHGKMMTYWGGQQFMAKLIMAFAFAGTEPIMGAMWFVYVLLLAFIGYSFISYIISKVVSDKYYELCRATVLLCLCVISCTLTQIFAITIPRGNNTITAIWLIYCGYVLRNILKIEFTNAFIVIISFLLLYHLSMINGCIHLNDNHYNDITVLTVSSVAALYIICYLCKRLETQWIGRVLSKCGKDSFHIMALHFIGFKLGITIINLLGGDINIASLKPDVGTNYFLVIYLFLFSILFSLSFIHIFREVKSAIYNKWYE